MDIFTELKNLGRVYRNRQNLKEYCVRHHEKIIKLLPQKIQSNDGPDVLDCMLNGLSDRSSLSTNIKVKVIDIVLQSFRQNTTSITHCNDVISRVCLEFSRCPVDDLVRWSSECVQSIVEDTDVNMIWRDVLPECLHAILSYNTVKHCNTEISSDLFKEKCVTTLCECRWKEKHLMQLTAMFKDMQLSRDDHRNVVNKICQHFHYATPESLPPLVHQLFKLCKTLDVDIALLHLCEYFRTKLYSKLEPVNNDSDYFEMDNNETEPKTRENLHICLGSCVYHIVEGASDPEFLVKRLLAWPVSQIWKNLLIIDILLLLSEKGSNFRGPCLTLLKDAIEQRELDEIRRKESSWVQEALSPDIDVAAAFKALTNGSIKHCNLRAMGLVNLAFVLLATSKSKPVAYNCWSHGRLILTRVCKCIPRATNEIIMQLSDKDLTLKQYSDCLFILCKLLPRSLDCCDHITTLLEKVLPLNNEYRPAARVYHAIHPLLRFSTKVRDCMVMLCRKTLYSKDSHSRCLALSGFLILLRYSKISDMPLRRSQMEQEHCSGQSYLSQLTTDMHATQSGTPYRSSFSNDSMCWEVIYIIKRCLIQDSNVKQLLYTDIYRSVVEKVILHEIVLETLYEHLFKYLCEDDSCPPLLWDKCVQATATSVVLIEPIGYLIYSISQFFRNVDDDMSEDVLSSQCEAAYVHLKKKLSRILDSFTSRELVTDVILGPDHISFKSSIPESKGKCMKIQQILQCYEALIAYKIELWTVSSENTHNIVLKLFKSYNVLLQYAKSMPKDTKKLKTTQNSSKDNNDSQVKNKVKEKTAPFKPLPCLWDLEFCAKIIQLLYSEEIGWCDKEHRNVIRTRREFHLFVLNRVHSKLNDDILEKNDVSVHGISIAKVLYNRCLLRFQHLCEFDEKTALACVELFEDFINLFQSKNYAFKIHSIMLAITGEATVSTSIAAVLEATLKAMMSLQTSDSQSDEVDADFKKLFSLLCNLASRVMCIPLSNCCIRLADVISEFDTYIRKTKNDILVLLPALLFVSSRDNQDSILIDDLLARLSFVLGVIVKDSVAEENLTFPSLDERSGHTALAQLCAHLTLVHRHIGLQITHAKQKVIALKPDLASSKDHIEKDLKQLKHSLVIQLCQLTKWTTTLGTIRCTIGSGGDKVLVAFIHLFSLLGDFVKVLSKNVSPNDIVLLNNIRLDRLMKLSGKPLSTSMDDLIDYLVRSQSNKKKSQEILKDTKNIPRLVQEAEQFKKLVVILSKKTKINYEEYMPVGTSRDFHIQASLLHEALDNVDDIQDADTVVGSFNNSLVSDNDEEEEQPAKKRGRV